MIEVNNLTRTFKKTELLKKTAKRVIKGEKCDNCNLSIVVVGEKRMKAINRKYRKKNKPTDVLSFSMDDDFSNRSRDLGEVVICPKQIKGKKGLERTIIHGILHLLSYDHKKKDDENKMVERENFYL
ncbi:MAG: rRNA maturation RNase YbeY [Candidatus Pacebacteria bacterium]|nr:rRNA maturation RNase YbeY [Candidatus Paceibacterota bacterium]MDD3072346.1 rRNA maturation RNase YbeY [Candidatus Paceibacterota bacterium]MDD3728724.1 rRNA maturation RNase YbeY [Candidatus Paceibacterota bacterium]MDD4201418.1 rRNA maturation RNase YbeY [Candidatus Paceibacterota bacterium]MDD4897206.1 rRNA maturation RNase YbeY [Candidatus Paceibacterota bacterium]